MNRIFIILSIELFCMACGSNTPEPFSTPVDLYTFQVGSDQTSTYIADSYSQVPITVAISNDDIAEEFRTIILNTNAGQFLNSGTTVDLDLTFKQHETVYLITGDSAGTFLITAQIKDTPKTYQDTVITLEPAYPDDFYLQTNATKVDSAGGQVNLSVTLLRANGKASCNIPVLFTSPNTIGYFSPPITFTDGTQSTSSDWIFSEGGLAKNTAIELAVTINGMSKTTTIYIKE